MTKLPSNVEIERSIEIVREMLRDVGGDMQAIDRESIQTLLSIAQSVKDGSIFMGASEIEEIMANTPTPSSDGDIHPGEFHIIAKALTNLKPVQPSQECPEDYELKHAIAWLEPLDGIETFTSDHKQAIGYLLKLAHSKLGKTPKDQEDCDCKPDRKGQKPSTPEGICPKCNLPHKDLKYQDITLEGIEKIIRPIYNDAGYDGGTKIRYIAKSILDYIEKGQRDE